MEGVNSICVTPNTKTPMRMSVLAVYLELLNEP